MSDPIATSDIPFGDPGRGVFAFRKGDRVPAHLVDEHDWQDYVSGASTQAAQKAVTDVTGESPAKTATVAKSSEKKG